ncbi:MAG TPA: hypothetical protein VFY84_19280 [Jiangellales bacterium]|nr:hypothetical protein [Jiangellales bacterium]
MTAEKIYAIAWFALAVVGGIVLPLALASRTRSLNHQYKGRRRARS